MGQLYFILSCVEYVVITALQRIVTVDNFTKLFQVKKTCLKKS